MQLPDLSRLTQDEKNALILVLWGQVQTLTAQVAVLHGPGVRAQLPPPRLWLRRSHNLLAAVTTL